MNNKYIFNIILKTKDSSKCKSLERKVINFNQELLNTYIIIYIHY